MTISATISDGRFTVGTSKEYSDLLTLRVYHTEDNDVNTFLVPDDVASLITVLETYQHAVK